MSAPLTGLTETDSDSDAGPVLLAALALLMLVVLNVSFLGLMSRLVRERGS